MDSTVTTAGAPADVLGRCRQAMDQLNEIEDLGDGTLMVGTQHFLPNFLQIDVQVKLGASGLVCADDGGMLVEYLEGREGEIAELVNTDARKLGITFADGMIGACVDRPEHAASMVVAVAKAVSTIAERLTGTHRG